MARRLCGALLLIVTMAGPTAAFMQPTAPEGFVQVNDVPASERLPAAPFLIAAYAFFLVLMIGYVWSIARRLDNVKRDMLALQRGSRSGSP